MNVAKKRVTYAEYLALEAASEQKHEYNAGVITAMAGATIAHGRLMSRLTILIGGALLGRPCLVMPSDVRVRIRAAERATYPDLHVVCGKIERDDEDQHAVVNPTAILEVLSEGTADVDRGETFAAYRRLVTLREYVLVSQSERRVDVLRRDGRRWHLDEYRSGERFTLESIAVELAVDDVYVDALAGIVAA
jgi:Uma2 family endonuclease